MKSKLYKLAIWYIAKCNAEWNKRKFADDLKSLDRLTYWNFGKYMLVYGADAEWRIFSRYEVLDNAIQKLAKYENEEQEIRNKAIDEFYDKVLNFEDYIEPLDTSEFGAVLLYSGKDITNMIVEIAKEMKEGANNGKG